MTTIQPRAPGLAGAVRAGAARLYSLEAARDLVISTGWPHRDDHTRFVTTGTPLTGGGTELAHIDWQSVISSRDAGLLTCGSGENRILPPAASIPVDLNDAPSGLDQASITLVVRAVRHANGQRPADHASFRRYDVRHMQGRESPHDASRSARKSRTRTGQAESLHRSSAHGECGEKAHDLDLGRAPFRLRHRPGLRRTRRPRPGRKGHGHLRPRRPPRSGNRTGRPDRRGSPTGDQPTFP